MSKRWLPPCSMPTTSAWSTAMSNQRTCYSAPVPRSCSVTLAWPCSRRTPSRPAPKRWNNHWPEPPRTWLPNNSTASLDHPATSMRWASWSMNGCPALLPSTALPLRSPCSTSRCLHLPCGNGCPICRLASRRSCCGRSPKNQGSVLPLCRTLLLPYSTPVMNLPLCLSLPLLLRQVQQFALVLLSRPCISSCWAISCWSRVRRRSPASMCRACNPCSPI